MLAGNNLRLRVLSFFCRHDHRDSGEFSGSRVPGAHGLLLGALASSPLDGSDGALLPDARDQLEICRVTELTVESFFIFWAASEFIVRRCFFPYALPAFALFNLMNVRSH